MRLTIIPSDKTIGINNVFYTGIKTDFSWIPENVHALQWYDTYGELEFNDGSANQKIEDLGIYSEAITHHENETLRISKERIKAEELYNNSDWSKLLRKSRNSRLFDSDWTQLPDNSLTDEQKNSWKNYRQELRDLPSTITVNPRELVENKDHEDWPTPPN